MDGTDGRHNFTRSVSWECTDQTMMNLLKSRDPYSAGIRSVEALRLLMSLLVWNPYERITGEQALDSPIFSAM